MPAAEQEALFKAADAAIDAGVFQSRSKATMFDGTAHRMKYSFSPPDRQGILWWCQGWLFAFIADDPAFDLDGFRVQYLTQIRGAPASDPETALPEVGEATEALESTAEAPEAAPQQSDN